MSRFFIFLLLTLGATTALTPEICLAAETVKNNGPSAGILMGAVMEQVGYHAQAEILKNLNGYLQYLGALIYLGILFSMIFAVSVSGQSRGALWALVGPPLFFWASGLEVAGFKNTIEGAGVEWRFGAFDDTNNANEKKELMERPDTGTPGEVSFLFHKYNELVSEVFQKAISVVTDNDMRKQMMFMTRQRVLEELFGDQITHPDITSLAAFFMAHCSSEISYARILARGNREQSMRDDEDYAIAKEQYCRLFDTDLKPFPPGRWQEYVRNNNLDLPEQGKHGKDYARSHNKVTCAQMWRWLRHGAVQEINKRHDELKVKLSTKTAIKIYGTTLYNDAVAGAKGIYDKITSFLKIETERLSSPGDPCPAASGTGEGGGSVGDDFDSVTDIFAGYLNKKANAKYACSKAIWHHRKWTFRFLSRLCCALC